MPRKPATATSNGLARNRPKPPPWPAQPLRPPRPTIPRGLNSAPRKRQAPIAPPARRRRRLRVRPRCRRPMSSKPPTIKRNSRPTRPTTMRWPVPSNRTPAAN
ncbi:hypothetical protein B0T45_17770 [Chromobacterium haemolyticum]|uniref:Uncharacterized protein n=1 Tax=Chromobacterium haemolyticum TaxID=394935 RepID=A0A1W0CKE5_9NEIS|nr:hypothetical protein B0T45_17770 [Chromobacterium haemolyticum]